MNSIKANFVLSFEHRYELTVKECFDAILFENTKNRLIVEKNDLCLIINERDTDNLSEWLTKTIKIVDYPTNKKVIDLASGCIIHAYLRVNQFSDKFDLTLSGEQLCFLWKLATIIDIDYGINIEHF